MAKSSAGVDDGVTLINAGAFGGSGGVPLFTVFLTIVAAALFVQVLRVEDQEHITPVDVIVERGLTDRGVKLGRLCLELCQQSGGRIVLLHNFLLHIVCKVNVIANLEVRPLGPEVFLVFALRHLRAVAPDKLIVRGHLLGPAPFDFVVDGLFAHAQRLSDLGLAVTHLEHLFNDQAILPLQLMKALVIHVIPSSEYKKAAG